MKSNFLWLSNVFMVACVFSAYMIGSGFATGQEVLQYFVMYGYWGLTGGVICFVLLSYVCISFLNTGHVYKLKKSTDVYYFYCGPIFGKFYDYFSTIFCFFLLTIMLAGAGAVMEQQFSQATYIGAIIIAVLALFTVIGGFNTVVNILAKLGVILTIVIILLSIKTIWLHSDNLITFQQHSINNKQGLPGFYRASSNWWLAAINYVGFCLLILGAFMVTLGASIKTKKEVIAGGLLGPLIFFISTIIVSLGLLSQFELIWDQQVPMLILANQLSKSFSIIVTIIIFIGIYTTTVPLLWNVSNRIIEKKSIGSKFKITTLLIVTAAIIIGLYLPFDKLSNILLVTNGYAGIILLCIMLHKTFLGVFQTK